MARSVMNMGRRSLSFVAVSLFVISVLASNTLFVAKSLAVSGQLGEDQVTLNPGGGILANGNDGLRFTANSEGNDGITHDWDFAGTAGQDALVYRGTYQYCCSAGGPQLNIGGTLYGQAGASADNESVASFDSVAITASSGSAVVGTRDSDTGNGSATLHYVITHNTRTYTFDRTITYVYPNNYVTENYSFVIPSGNTEVVKFYLGGDTSPGSDDNGYGVMLTTPVRSVMSLNPDTAMAFGIREVASSRTFDGATSQLYNDNYPTLESGGDIGFNVDHNEHDAGLTMQWTLGTTPNTYTGSLQQFVVKQGANLSAAYSPTSTTPGASADLTLSLENVMSDTAFGLGYILRLPEGLDFADNVSANTCGGTTSIAPEIDEEPIDGVAVQLSGVTLDPSESCSITVPVFGEEPGNYPFVQAPTWNAEDQSTDEVSYVYDQNGGVDSDALDDTSLTIESVPNTFGNDKNGDDIDDDEQANVAVVPSDITGKVVVLEVDDNCAIDTSALKAETANAALDPAFEYPQGLLNFTVDCGDPGYETTVKQYYYDVSPTGLTMRKYNPTLKTYVTVPNATFTTGTAYGHTATIGTYKVKDGGSLDLDGLENGIIVDPAGPGVQSVAVPNTGFARR